MSFQSRPPLSTLQSACLKIGDSLADAGDERGLTLVDVAEALGIVNSLLLDPTADMKSFSHLVNGFGQEARSTERTVVVHRPNLDTPKLIEDLLNPAIPDSPTLRAAAAERLHEATEIIAIYLSRLQDGEAN